MSKPLQVYIDEKELRLLEAWASKRKWTKSQAIRAAVRALVRSEEADPLLAASGMIDGLPEDCSEQFDRHVMETFVAKRQVQSRKENTWSSRRRAHR